MERNSINVWRFAAGAAAAAVALFLVWYFSSIVVYILVAAVLAVVGAPLVGRLERLEVRGRRMPRSLAALATLAVISVVADSIKKNFLPLVFHKVHQAATLDFALVTQGIAEPLEGMQRYMGDLLALPDSFSLSDSIAESLHGLVSIDSLNLLLSSIVGITLSTVVAVFSISFITFFFLKDDRLFYRMVASAFPDRYHSGITRALDEVTVLLSRYFTGILAESLLLTVAAMLAMMAFGMPAADASFIGLVMGVMNVVPYAGPLIGGVVSVAVGIVTPIEGMTAGRTALVIACTLLVLKGLDDFVLQPTLYSERVKAHPLEIFLVILIAGSVAGILGMLLAIPSYTVLRVFAKEFFSQFRLVRQLTDKI